MKLRPPSGALPWRRASDPRAEQRASVLVIVLWISFGLVVLALYFSQSANLEFRAADNRVAALEAEQAIEGAVRYLTNVLATVQTNNGTLPDPLTYQQTAMPVGDAMVWLIGRDTNDWQTGPDVPVFGLVDEASKLNLNTATAAMLQWLPRMTPDLAANIVAWRESASSSSNSSAGSSSSTGVQSGTYLRLSLPYLCKNSPFETVDELHLVYGLTNALLYGEDMNLNGVLDANENDGDATAPPDDANGRLDPGLFEYVTIWSREPNITGEGSNRIDVTTTSGQQQFASLLQQKFSVSRANEILLSVGLSGAGGGTNRTGGGGTGGGGASGGGGGTSGGPGGGGATTTPTFGSVMQFYLTSGMTEDEFAQIADYITTTNSTYLDGLVNVNTAREAVLGCIPGVGTNNAPALVAYRLSHADKLSTVAWVADVLDRTSAIQAGPYVTTRSFQYTADLAAVGHHGRGYRRVKFVFDTGEGLPMIRYRQDLTSLGWALGRDVRNKLQLAAETGTPLAAGMLRTLR